MERTIVENQQVILKEKIKNFFTNVILESKEGPCPIKDMLAPSLDKWSLFVVFNLGYNGVMRFSELKKRVRGISSRMLSITLKRLETTGIVVRTVYAEVPPRVEYQLTPIGEGFSERLIEMSMWYVGQIREQANPSDVS